MYQRLQDSRDGSNNDPFPATHYWASAGEPSYEHLRWADGREHESGEDDTAGFLFAVRGLEGPDDYPYTADWPWALQGDADDAY